MTAPDTILRLEDASMRWPGPSGEVIALQPTSMSLAAGDLAVIRGPSGAGKTTLLLIAGGMLSASSGIATVEGGVGFVFQTLELLPYLDVRENIRVGQSADGTTEEVENLIERLGLGHRAAHRPHELSTGECQRVATARALAGRPALLVADEPTGNLDEENADHVRAALEQHASDGGAVLFATHGSTEGMAINRSFTIENGHLHEVTE